MCAKKKREREKEGEGREKDALCSARASERLFTCSVRSFVSERVSDRTSEYHKVRVDVGYISVCTCVVAPECVSLCCCLYASERQALGGEYGEVW